MSGRVKSRERQRAAASRVGPGSFKYDIATDIMEWIIVAPSTEEESTVLRSKGIKTNMDIHNSSEYLLPLGRWWKTGGWNGVRVRVRVRVRARAIGLLG
jgi:hypothetical protein